MDGLQIIVPGLDGHLPVDAPRVPLVDPIEPPNGGALLLIEPAHPKNPWVAGVPASGSSIPNLMATDAAATMGVAESATHPTLVYANLDGTTKGKVERTTKDALHVIVSQAVGMTTESNTALLPSLHIPHTAAMEAYQYAHHTNDVYVSIWVNVTRAYKTGTLGAFSGESGTRTFMFRSGGGNQRILGFGTGTPVGVDLGVRDTRPTTTGAKLASHGSSTWASALASATAMDDQFITIGGVGSLNLTQSSPNTARGRWPSLVLYRVYVEDLTVSGRSYAEVDALDLALFTKHVLTVGGRYYGDTIPTAPATIP